MKNVTTVFCLFVFTNNINDNLWGNVLYTLDSGFGPHFPSHLCVSVCNTLGRHGDSSMAILEAEKASLRALRHGLHQALGFITHTRQAVEKTRQGVWGNHCTLWDELQEDAQG
jgi:hypothetical protein